MPYVTISILSSCVFAKVRHCRSCLKTSRRCGMLKATQLPSLKACRKWRMDWCSKSIILCKSPQVLMLMVLVLVGFDFDQFTMHHQLSLASHCRYLMMLMMPVSFEFVQLMMQSFISCKSPVIKAITSISAITLHESLRDHHIWLEIFQLLFIYLFVFEACNTEVIIRNKVHYILTTVQSYSYYAREIWL